MSVIKIARLYCNGPIETCPQQGSPFETDIMGVATPAEVVRRDAKEAGWVVSAPGGKDFCSPECQRFGASAGGEHHG